MSQLNETQIAIFSYLKSLNLKPSLFANDEKEKVLVQVLNSNSDNTKDLVRFKHYFSLTFSSTKALALTQEQAEKVSTELMGQNCPLNNYMSETYVALVANDGISIFIDSINGEILYKVTLDLEITTEPLAIKKG